MQPLERFRRECAAFFDALSLTGQRTLVFGEGNGNGPLLMLVGEAPGEQEALQGRPFVGKAGKNLDGFLEALRLRRGDIYITNVVKVRPSKISAAGRVVNRPPTREEKVLFTPWLMKEVAIVRPAALYTSATWKRWRLPFDKAGPLTFERRECGFETRERDRTKESCYDILEQKARGLQMGEKCSLWNGCRF